MNLIITSVGKRIELFRTAIGMKQIPFALKLGKSERTIGSWENSKGEPKHKDLEKMVEMGANPIFLLTGKGSILREGFKRGS